LRNLRISILLQIAEQRRMRFLIGQRLGPLFASFHDELIHSKIDGQGIIAVETSEAKAVQWSSRRAHHTFYVEVTQTINTEIFADVIHRHLIGDQLFRVWKIDAVMTGEPMWRTAHAHVHFFGAGLAQVHHARPRCRAAHDRVVYNHHAFSSNDFLYQIQLYAHVEIADQLTRLQKCAPDVVIADESVSVRNFQFLSKTESRVIS